MNAPLVSHLAKWRPPASNDLMDRFCVLVSSAAIREPFLHSSDGDSGFHSKVGNGRVARIRMLDILDVPIAQEA